MARVRLGADVAIGPGSPPSRDARGLRWFEISLANQGELERIASRIEAQWSGDRLFLSDPSGNGLALGAVSGSDGAGLARS